VAAALDEIVVLARLGDFAVFYCQDAAGHFDRREAMRRKRRRCRPEGRRYMSEEVAAAD
jgi:hypothetical protein